MSSFIEVKKDNHRYITIYCSSCGFNKQVRLYCKSRLCPVCKERNYFRLLRIYKPLIKKVPSYRCSQITLTYKNFKYLNYSIVNSLYKDFYKLRKTKLFKDKVKGGLAVVECKHKDEKTGWNLHLHILSDSLFIPQKALSKEWQRITGHSFIVDIRKEENGPRAVRHLLKYFLKVPIIRSSHGRTKQLRKEFEETFYGKRLIISFGSLYSSIAERKDYNYECPNCHNIKTFILADELVRLREMAYVRAGPD